MTRNIKTYQAVLAVTRIIIAITAFMCIYVSTANAQVIYKSNQNGISVQMPKGVQVVKDDDTILHLKANGMEFSAHPMFTENLTPEKLAEGLNKVANAFGFEISDDCRMDFENQTMAGAFFCHVKDGVFCAVGSAYIEGVDEIVFMLTINAPVALEDDIDALINSLAFKID